MIAGKAKRKSLKDFRLDVFQEQNLSDQIAERIEQMILGDSFSPGERLPGERQLSQKFGVTRSSLREAIRILEQRGLVQQKAGLGTFVKDVDHSQICNAIQRYFIHSGSTQRDVLDFRMLVEPEAAARAAADGSDEFFQQFTAAFEQMEAAYKARDKEAHIEADIRFHEVISSAADNHLISATMFAMHRLMRWWMEQGINYWGTPGHRTHREIYEAIMARDSQKARQAIKDHIQVGFQFMAGDPESIKSDGE